MANIRKTNQTKLIIMRLGNGLKQESSKQREILATQDQALRKNKDNDRIEKTTIDSKCCLCK